jgi:hypothetical protein
MICTWPPAGTVRSVILLVLIGFILGTAGCIEPITGNDSSGNTAGSAIAPGNETNASSRSEDLTRGMQGFIARPVKSLDRSKSGSAPIPVPRTTDAASWSGPALIAKGNEVNITDVQILTETLLPQ